MLPVTVVFDCNVVMAIVDVGVGVSALLLPTGALNAALALATAPGPLLDEEWRDKNTPATTTPTARHNSSSMMGIKALFFT